MPFNILGHGIQNITGLAEGIFFGRGLSTNAIPVQFESLLGRTVTTEFTGACGRLVDGRTHGDACPSAH